MSIHLWDWTSTRAKGEPARLADLLAELEPLVHSLVGRALPILAAPGWGHTDGHTVFLPASFDLLPSLADNRRFYRHSALHKGLALRLGQQRHPAGSSLLLRDLLYLLEGERSGQCLQSYDPRLFQEERELALKLLVLRGPAHGHKARALESLARLLLGSDPRRVAHGGAEELGLAIFRELPQPYEVWHPDSSLGLAHWAEERLSRLPGTYQPIEAVPVWGDRLPV